MRALTALVQPCLWPMLLATAIWELGARTARVLLLATSLPESLTGLANRLQASLHLADRFLLLLAGLVIVFVIPEFAVRRTNAWRGRMLAALGVLSLAGAVLDVGWGGRVPWARYAPNLIAVAAFATVLAPLVASTRTSPWRLGVLLLPIAAALPHVWRWAVLQGSDGDVVATLRHDIDILVPVSLATLLLVPGRFPRDLRDYFALGAGAAVVAAALFIGEDGLRLAAETSALWCTALPPAAWAILAGAGAFALARLTLLLPNAALTRAAWLLVLTGFRSDSAAMPLVGYLVATELHRWASGKD